MGSGGPLGDDDLPLSAKSPRSPSPGTNLAQATSPLARSLFFSSQSWKSSMLMETPLLDDLKLPAHVPCEVTLISSLSLACGFFMIFQHNRPTEFLARRGNHLFTLLLVPQLPGGTGESLSPSRSFHVHPDCYTKHPGQSRVKLLPGVVCGCNPEIALVSQIFRKQPQESLRFL